MTTSLLKPTRKLQWLKEKKQVAYDDGFEDENNVPGSKKKKKKMKLLKEAAEADNRGVCYLSRVPPHMDHVKLRQLLSQYGEILRIYLTPSGHQPQVKGKRSRPSKVQEQEFSEGLVEFARKGIAKRVANMLNGEQVAYKSAIREQKLALELSAAKRERDFSLSKVDQCRALSAIEERMKKKQKMQEESGMNSELPVTQKKAIRQFRQKKPVAVDSSQGEPRLSKDILAGYSLVLSNQGLKMLGWHSMSEELLPVSMNSCNRVGTSLFTVMLFCSGGIRKRKVPCNICSLSCFNLDPHQCRTTVSLYFWYDLSEYETISDEDSSCWISVLFLESISLLVVSVQKLEKKMGLVVNIYIC